MRSELLCTLSQRFLGIWFLILPELLLLNYNFSKSNVHLGHMSIFVELVVVVTRLSLHVCPHQHHVLKMDFSCQKGHSKLLAQTCLYAPVYYAPCSRCLRHWNSTAVYQQLSGGSEWSKQEQGCAEPPM